METQEVAKKWHSMCQAGKNLECIDQLYSDNVKSREMPGSPHEVIEGKRKVWEKSKQWLESVAEFHGSHISEPIVADNHFTSKMDFDITFKERGRQKMEELGVFEVKDGKIVNEQFFYSM